MPEEQLNCQQKKTSIKSTSFRIEIVTAFIQVVVFPTVIELVHWGGGGYGSAGTMRPRFISSVKKKKKSSKFKYKLNVGAGWNTVGDVYLKWNPSNRAVSAGVSPLRPGWSTRTSTSKAVACAVISIAGSVTTQPTAQTTTSASTWSNGDDDERKNKPMGDNWERNTPSPPVLHPQAAGDRRSSTTPPLQLTWNTRETPPKLPPPPPPPPPFSPLIWPTPRRPNTGLADLQGTQVNGGWKPLWPFKLFTVHLLCYTH